MISPIHQKRKPPGRDTKNRRACKIRSFFCYILEGISTRLRLKYNSTNYSEIVEVERLRIAVVGATGEVGRMMVKVLEEYGIEPSELRLYASRRSAGTKLIFQDREITVSELSEEAMKDGFDYALFSAGADVSKHFAPIAASHGTIVIDNSSAFRLVEGIPLVVPEINGYLVDDYRGIIANPNCSTIQMVLSLYTVHREFEIRRIVVSTYQAVSGAGRKAIDELQKQMEGSDEHSIFPQKIHLNVIPQIGSFDETGFSTEELKMINETRKILNDPSIDVVPTTVRVPVLYGHSEAVYVETKKPFESYQQLRETIERAEDVKIVDDFVTPLEVAGSDIVYVSRIRVLDENRFVFWNVADNIRVGAATNAVRILKRSLGGAT